MKKFLALSIAILVLITLSGCQFNIFAAFDKIEIPSAADLSSKASSDPDGFLDDVNDYVDSESITEDNADAVIAALEDVYDDAAIQPAGMSDAEWEDIQEEAAVLTGEIAISSDPETKELVDNVVSALTGLSDTTTAEDVLAGIFPPNLSEAQFYDILDNLNTAALAYADFAASIDNNPADGVADDGAAAWLDSTDAGDLAMYAAVAMIASDIRNLPGVSDADLYNFIYDDSVTTIGTYDEAVDGNPLDTNALSAILDLAGIVY